MQCAKQVCDLHEHLPNRKSTQKETCATLSGTNPVFVVIAKTVVSKHRRSGI